MNPRSTHPLSKLSTAALSCLLVCGLWGCPDDTTSSEGGNDVGTTSGRDASRNLSDSGQTTSSGADDGGTGEVGQVSDTGSAEQDDGGVAVDTGPPPDLNVTCGVGRIEGRVCAPSENVYIGGATVTISGVDCGGTEFEYSVESDSDGYFVFPEVPSGSHAIHITKGSFETTLGANVGPGQTLDFAAGGDKACLVDREVRIAALYGFYDSIEDILDVLGLEYTFYGPSEDVSDEQALRSSTTLEQYDILFINCGEQWINYGFDQIEQDPVFDAIGTNLRNFVMGGGSVYISDNAYFLIERAFPDMATFSDNESVITAGFRGAIGAVTADVTDAALERALGSATFTIDYPNQGWAFPHQVADGVNVLMRSDVLLAGDAGTISDAPLLFSYRPTPTAGQVIYTSFHNEAQTAADIQKILQQLAFSL